MSKLQYTNKQENDKNIITLIGQIDESFPSDLQNLKPNGDLVIDLEQVKMINSLGIREWIKFVNSLGAVKVELINVPKIIIDQINMVQGFITANCSVSSFYVPYFNEDVNVEKNILYSVGKEYGSGYLNIEHTIKVDDGIELELDVLEQKYFKFLKTKLNE